VSVEVRRLSLPRLLRQAHPHDDGIAEIALTAAGRRSHVRWSNK